MTTLINILLNTLAKEYSTPEKTVKNILSLFEEGATVPFIARYRKEVTGAMTDETLREFHGRWLYLVELEKRRIAIVELLKELPDIPASVFSAVEKASSKTELEDIYAPFKKTRKTKADSAIELGLLPFSIALWRDGVALAQQHYEQTKASFKQPLSLAEAKAGASDIIVEKLSQNIHTLQQGKLFLQKEGVLVSKVMRGKKEVGEKFRDYFDYREALKKCPPHRLLALFRGKKESILKLAIESGEALPYPLNNTVNTIPLGFPELKERTPSKEKLAWLEKAWLEKIQPKLESDLLAELKELAEAGAIEVFQNNLKDLLMAAPAGAKRTLALDPGFRNGVKWAAVDEYGQLLDYGVVYPHPPQNKANETQAKLTQAIQVHNIEWLVIGNGTASRETQTLVEDMIQQRSLNCRCVIVSEAGASVYSASPVAIEEFPELDVTIRGAISIARRFQDPLAELVKIDPQAIGVGQYQHDVKANRLGDALSVVVEDCVNAVGVDLNLASVSLLTYVSGLTQRMAQNIVEFREQVGGFSSRMQLKKVKGIGEKAFEQCAGFLRIRGGSEPLDASAVHPESYSVIKGLARSIDLELNALVGNPEGIARLKTAPAAAEQGQYTFQDILQELAKPGRDPRPEFQYASFDEAVNKIEDLQEGMSLEGVVTNVAAFGAFVDLGVHQDGLIHISQLADRFVKDPRDEVRIGEVVKVQVIEVDVQRKRIALKRLK
ncbi:30S ribosomal protein S1 [Marinomonas gallaica]|uniref:30S ribosomal protein S1 n=1 Tax=Marinomonas gallaica TaxID=1806667 RepID=A0A1C3JW35_9GAMM|nr:Tex family protein [Marinomonas gallaica]SBT19270.1 30S ribosomal protein S1 [Marinomonas gallaica]SBT20959.1 30S ribosomal protein S1 [Marinomonas gallaica]